MLIAQQWRRQVASLVGWSVTLFTTTLLTLLAVKSLLTGPSLGQLTLLIEQLPPALRAYMGVTPGEVTVNTWVISLVFRTIAPLVLTVYTALAALSVLTRDMDAGVADFLLALPLRRERLLLSRFLVAVLNIAVLHGALLLSVFLGTRMVGYEPRWREYALMVLNSYLVQAALLSLVLLITVFVTDYTQGLFVALGLSLGLYFLSLAIEPGTKLAGLRWLSVFTYSRPNEVMRTGGIPPGDAAVLLISFVCLLAAAVFLFNSKQIST